MVIYMKCVWEQQPEPREPMLSKIPGPLEKESWRGGDGVGGKERRGLKKEGGK